MRRRQAVFASDVRQLGGAISVYCGRDRVESTPVYTVGYISRGGDLRWRSAPIPDADRAFAAAELLAQFVGGQLLDAHPPPESERAARAGDPNSFADQHRHSSDFVATAQAAHVAQHYRMPLATAATVAELAYSSVAADD